MHRLLCFAGLGYGPLIAAYSVEPISVRSTNGNMLIFHDRRATKQRQYKGGFIKNVNLNAKCSIIQPQNNVQQIGVIVVVFL